jgi:hypothetical protein
VKLRILLAALLGTAVVLVPVPASAKGPTEVEITGPGLDEPIRLDWDSANASPMQMLTEILHGPAPAYRVAPSEQLGPRYAVRFTMAGPDGEEVTRQHLYPFADDGPLVRTPPGQTLYGEAQASGWQRGPDDLDSLLVSLGAHAPPDADLEWLTYEDYEHGLSISHPPGWQPARSTVAPALLDPVIPLALGTYAFPTHGCGAVPGPALEALGRKDAFIAVYVFGGSATWGPNVPARPERFGPELPWSDGPFKCTENVQADVRSLNFPDNGLRLDVLIAIGPDAPREREQTVYRILDTLTVASPSAPREPAG